MFSEGLPCCFSSHSMLAVARQHTVMWNSMILYLRVRKHGSVFFFFFFYFQKNFFFSLKVEPIPPQCLKGSICEIEKRIMLSFCWWAPWKRQTEIPSSKENLQTLLHIRSADSKSSEKNLSWWLLSTLRLYSRRDENGLLIITLWTFSERWPSLLKGADSSLPMSFYNAGSTIMLDMHL